MRLYRISWALWIAGSLVIALSWLRLVTPQIGWIGWGVALLGTVLSLFQKQRTPPPGWLPSTAMADLDRLVQMRDRGDITEEQYLRQRNAILGEPGASKHKDS